jgi:hypothetical protein
MTDKYKIVSGEYFLSFTTKNVNELPKPSTMNHEIQELFAGVLDKYLSDRNIEGEEVHLILCDGISIEDEEE